MYRIICLFLVLLNSLLGSAQNVFHKTWAGLEISNTSYITANANGGYYIGVDYIGSTTQVNEWFIISSYDKCDSLLWTKTFQTQNTGLKIRHIKSTKNGDVLIAGSYEDASGDVFLAKLSKEGSLSFFKRYEGSEHELIYSAGECANGDFFVYGMTHDAVSRHRTFILRTNEKGEFLWAKEYFNIPIWGRGTATSDNGILANTGNVIYKVDDNGNVTWAKDFNDQLGYYQTYPLEVEGGYIFARYENSNFYDSTSYLYKIDFNGDVLWKGDYFKGTLLNRVIKANDRLYTVANYYFSGTTDYAMSLIEFSEKGDFLRQIYLSNPTDELVRAFDISALSNGRILTSGIQSNSLQQTNRLCYSMTNTSLDFDQCDQEITYQPIGKGEIKENTISVTPININFVELNISAIVKDFPLNEEVSCFKELPIDLDLGLDITVCKNNSLTIESNSDFERYLWSTGDTTKSIIIEVEGEYWLQVESECKSDIDTIMVSYFPSITPKFYVNPLKTSPLQLVSFKGENDSSLAIFWDFGLGTSEKRSFKHRFEKNGIFPVFYEVTDSNGCVYFDSTQVEVEHVSIYVPNAFTANGDDVNESFGPIGFGIKEFKIIIYSRMGELIFEENNKAWDGKMNGELAMIGQYVYLIEVTDDFGKVYKYSGLVSLIR